VIISLSPNNYTKLQFRNYPKIIANAALVSPQQPLTKHCQDSAEKSLAWAHFDLDQDNKLNP